jgi:Response regulators consisting of a CheY-like receiver domain and a winged-helix DNA-binding domain
MTEDGAPRHLLIVEDERHLATGLKLNFEFEGYRVDIAGTAREAAAALARAEPFDAIVMDVTLPDSDGFELVRRMRGAGNFTPVIMLTARSLAEDRVTGLESGADDYLTKPFELDELLARVGALIRRRRWEAARNDTPASSVMRFGDAVVDFDTHEATAGGAPVKLTSLEMALLQYFFHNAGRVISRDELLQQVWKLRNYPNTRTVDNFVLRLRKHFEPDPATPVFFRSIRGAGYKFVIEGDQEA